MRLVAIIICTLAASASAAFAQNFSFEEFQIDPAGYASARYPLDAVARELRDDLETDGFDCVEAGANAICERWEMARPNCRRVDRVTITQGVAPATSQRWQCTGLVAPPARSN